MIQNCMPCWDECFARGSKQGQKENEVETSWAKMFSWKYGQSSDHFACMWVQILATGSILCALWPIHIHLINSVQSMS